MLIGYSVQNFRYVFEALDMTLIGHFAFSDRDEGVIDRDTYHNGVCMSPTLLCDMTTKSLLDIYPYDRENHYSPYRYIEFWIGNRIAYYMCDLMFNSLMQAMESGQVEEISRDMTLPLPNLLQFVFVGYNNLGLTKQISLAAIYNDGRAPEYLL